MTLCISSTEHHREQQHPDQLDPGKETAELLLTKQGPTNHT
jgi:hypothetical protein